MAPGQELSFRKVFGQYSSGTQVVRVFVLVEETDSYVSAKHEDLGAVSEKFAEGLVVYEADVDLSFDRCPSSVNPACCYPQSDLIPRNWLP